MSEWGLSVDRYVREKEEEKNNAARRQVVGSFRQKVGAPDPYQPSNSNSPFIPKYAHTYTSRPVKPPTFNEKEMTDRIIRESIADNWKTGGRHPKAAPPKPQKPKATVEENPGGGRNSAPPRAGADKNAKGTKMGGLSGDLGAFQKVLESKGIGFNFDSGQLPTSSNHLVSFHDVNKNVGSVLDKETAERLASNISQSHDYHSAGKDIPFKLGDPSLQTGARFIDGDTYEVLAKGIQADKSDADRALPVNRSTTRDPRQGSSRDYVLSDGFGGDDGWGDDDGYGGYTGRDMNARSKAFLEYGGNTAMALRAAEAAQGTIRQNGKTYGKNAEGKWTLLKEDAAKALKQDGNLVATADYVTDNAYTEKPAKELANETLSKHLEINKQKLSHGEYLDLTNEGPLANEENVVTFANGKTFTMDQLNDNEDLWKQNY